MKLEEIAAALGCTLEGPKDLEITSVAPIENAGPGDLTFLSNSKYRSKVHSTGAAAVILSAEEPDPGRPALRSPNPYLAFAQALELFYPPSKPAPGIHPTVVVGRNARIGERAAIGAYVVIEDGVTIGDDCVLRSHVVIYHGAKIGARFQAHSHAVVRENAVIGDDVILQNGAVVGSDGFGFARRADGSYHKIVPAGGVVIEDGVEVQAYACIDRATIGETRIRRGAKIDNLVQIGHSCDIGENTLLCGQAGLAGTSKIGKNVILAGQTGVAGHLSIGDSVIVTAQSGVGSDVEPNRIVSGSPAIDNLLWLKCTAIFAKLPEIYRLFRKWQGR